MLVQLRSFLAGFAGAGQVGHAGQVGQGAQTFSGGQTTAGGHGGHAGAGGTTFAGAGGGVSPFFASWKHPQPPKVNTNTTITARITEKLRFITTSSFLIYFIIGHNHPGYSKKACIYLLAFVHLQKYSLITPSNTVAGS